MHVVTTALACLRENPPKWRLPNIVNLFEPAQKQTIPYRHFLWLVHGNPKSPS